MSETSFETGQQQGEQQKVEQYRDIVIEAKAFDLAWAKGVKGKHVEFPQENGKIVWGIEVEVPLRFEEVSGVYKEMVKKFAEEGGVKVIDSQLTDAVEKNNGKTWFKGIRREASLLTSDDFVSLPKNIKRIRLIDLSPQEVLLKRQRNIDSDRNFWNNDDLLKSLTEQDLDRQILGPEGLNQPSRGMILQNKQEALVDLFYNVLNSKKEIVDRFLTSLNEQGVEEILFIHGHGGYDNKIGEQNGPTKPLTTTIEGEVVNLSDNQAEGNWIDLNEVIKKYDEEKDRGTILVSTCYLGNDNLSDRGYKSLIFRAKGKTGKGDHDLFSTFRKKTETLISQP